MIGLIRLSNSQIIYRRSSKKHLKYVAQLLMAEAEKLIPIKEQPIIFTLVLSDPDKELHLVELETSATPNYWKVVSGSIR